MRAANVLASICLILLGLLALIWVIPAQTVPVDPGELPGSLLPSVAAWVVVGAALWQLAQILLSGRKAASREPAAPGYGVDSRSSLLFFLGSALTLALFLLAIAQFGYLIGGAIGVLMLGWLMKPTGAARWWLLVVAAVVPAGVYYLALHLLRLSLP